MSKNIEQTLLNSLAYGTILRSDIPSEIEEYNVSLIRETREDLSITLKLKFVHKKNQKDIFYITIDSSRPPSNAIILLKYGEKTEKGDSKAYAKADAKIKQKMILSVEREEYKFQELEDNQSENNGEDSDIPKRRILYLSYEDESDSEVVAGYKGRKRRQQNESDDDE